MLIVGSRLDQTPVASLQTGSEIARVHEAIIDPANLSIVAYRVAGPLMTQPDTYVMIRDIRELSNVGFIIDSVDELINGGDVIAVDQIIEYDFRLVGTLVVSKSHKKLGKVSDYNIDIDTFTVQQLIVKRPLLHSLSETELVIDRSQIVEINDHAIVVDDATASISQPAAKLSGSYHNPFRSAKPAAEAIDRTKN